MHILKRSNFRGAFHIDLSSTSFEGFLSTKYHAELKLFMLHWYFLLDVLLHLGEDVLNHLTCSEPEILNNQLA